MKHKVGALVDGNYYDNGKREELKEKFTMSKNVKIDSVDKHIPERKKEELKKSE
ncbi:MAG: hypothetical protein LBV42_02360 [Methanobrevibacter sp.]|jgi:hypothetical protein|nr:hypothetical protein [Methanobrevibacter sp.]